VGEAEQVFLCEFDHTIDDKGRLTLPAKFRPDLGQSVVVTRGVDKCLFIFTLEEFQRIADRVGELPMTQAEGREFSRHFFSGASDVEVDKQGRILIPQNLREYAGLDGDVIVAGVNKRIEVWDAKAWQHVRSDFESKATNNADQWAKLGV
jgi:MraZ protein